MNSKVYSLYSYRLEISDLKDKVEKIQEHRLDSITSPSPSVKIQIVVGKVHLR